MTVVSTVEVRSALIWTWAGIVSVATVVLVTLGAGLAPGPGPTSALDAAMRVGFPMAFTALGALVAARAPGNRIAWILLLVGLSGLIDAWTALQVSERPDVVSVADVIALIWSNTGFFVGLLIPLFLLPFLFPDGRFLTARWRWAGWVAAAGSIEILVVQGLSPTLGPDTGVWAVPNPIGVLPASAMNDGRPAAAVFGFVLFALMIGGVVSTVARYRRSSETIRTQIKWIVSSLVVLVVATAAHLLLDRYRGAWWNSLMFNGALLLVPLAIAVAVTRYRLFDIDRIVSRTVGYAVVVMTLGLVYVVGAVWLPTRVVGTRPRVFVAGSTLVVVALFNTVRQHVMSWVDRRFYRSRYDAQRVAAGFVDRLQDELDVDDLTDDWVSVVIETMHPVTIGVWVPLRDDADG